MTNLNEQIEEELKKSGGNLSFVSRALGVDYHALKSRQQPASDNFKIVSGPEPLNIKLLGRPGFSQYVIAVKKAGQGWPEKYDGAIADARRKFDAGTHEMFQTVNQGWVVQYLIPYLVPRDRRQFFSSMIVIKTNG